MLELSCSAVARSNIDLAAERGEPIPEGGTWGRRPVDDRSAAGLPRAVLRSPGTRAQGRPWPWVPWPASSVERGSSPRRPPCPIRLQPERDLAHFLLVVDVAALGDPDEVLGRTNPYVGEISGSGPDPGAAGGAADATVGMGQAGGTAPPTNFVTAPGALADELGVPTADLG